MLPARIARVPLTRLDIARPCIRGPATLHRCIAIDSSTPHQNQNRSDLKSQKKEISKEQTKAGKKKTVTQQDEELRAKLEAASGDGGSAGVEYENGVAQGLKSQVKNNMFRVI